MDLVAFIDRMDSIALMDFIDLMDSIDLMDFRDLMDFTDLMDFIDILDFIDIQFGRTPKFEAVLKLCMIFALLFCWSSMFFLFAPSLKVGGLAAGALTREGELSSLQAQWLSAGQRPEAPSGR